MARARRQFLGPGCGRGAGWEEEASLGAEVALREEEEDGLRALDVLLKRPDILQIIYL